jgi:hypothetical protein
LLFFPPLSLLPPPMLLLLLLSPLSPSPLSERHPLLVSSHRLVVALPLVAPPSHCPLTPPISSSCPGWLLHCLLSCHPLVVPLSHPVLVLSLCHPLVVSSHRLVVALPLVAPPSCRPLTPPLFCRLAPADCCVASHHAALLSSCRASLLSSRRPLPLTF